MESKAKFVTYLIDEGVLKGDEYCNLPCEGRSSQCINIYQNDATETYLEEFCHCSERRFGEHCQFTSENRNIISVATGSDWIYMAIPFIMVISFLAGYFFKQFMSNRSDETRLPTAAEYREN